MDFLGSFLLYFVVFGGGFAIVTAVFSLLLIGFGLAARTAPVGARYAMWPIGLALALGLFPFLFIAALFMGFMTPTFGGHNLTTKDQSWGQKGLNGLFELIAAPWNNGVEQAPVTDALPSA
jgi:hypothetical protein